MATLNGLFTLGRNAELRSTNNGEQVASMAVAYNYGRKGQDGKTPSQWVDAALWGDRAAKLIDYLNKGTQFYMQIDDLHVETYPKNDGTTGVKLVGRVGQIEFTRGQRQQAAAPAPPPQRTPSQPGKVTVQKSGFDDMDADIPF